MYTENQKDLKGFVFDTDIIPDLNFHEEISIVNNKDDTEGEIENSTLNSSEKPIKVHLIEFNMENKLPEKRPENSVPSLARSMFAGYCSKYHSDFVLMGVSQYDFRTDLVDDLKLWVDKGIQSL